MSVPCLAILTQMQVSRRNVRSYLRINARVLSNNEFGRRKDRRQESQCGGPDDSISTCLLRTKNALRGITKMESI
jgi:hypothetical protein